jgi:hypothetical protein
MSSVLTSQLSDETQEALKFLQEKNIDINRTINRIVMRAAQEEGWHIALVPADASRQEKAPVKESPPAVEALEVEPQTGNKNSNQSASIAPAPNVQPERMNRPVETTPIPAEKPFEPGVVLADTAQNQGDLPHPSTVVKKQQ